MTDIIALRSKINNILTEGEVIEEGLARTLAIILGGAYLTYASLLGTAVFRMVQNAETAPIDGSVSQTQAQYCLDEHGHLVTIKFPADRRNPNNLQVQVVYRNPGTPGTGREEAVNGNQLVPLFLVNERVVTVSRVTGDSVTIRDIQTGTSSTVPVAEVRPFVKGQMNGPRRDALQAVLQNTPPQS